MLPYILWLPTSRKCAWLKGTCERHSCSVIGVKIIYRSPFQSHLCGSDRAPFKRWFTGRGSSCVDAIYGSQTLTGSVQSIVQIDRDMIIRATYFFQERFWHSGWRAGLRFWPVQRMLELRMGDAKTVHIRLRKQDVLLHIWLMDNPWVGAYRVLRSGSREQVDIRHFHTEKLVTREHNSGSCSLEALLNLFSIENRTSVVRQTQSELLKTHITFGTMREDAEMRNRLK